MMQKHLANRTARALQTPSVHRSLIGHALPLFSLYRTKTISVSEYYTGFAYIIKHGSGRRKAALQFPRQPRKPKGHRHLPGDATWGSPRRMLTLASPPTCFRRKAGLHNTRCDRLLRVYFLYICFGYYHRQRFTTSQRLELRLRAFQQPASCNLRAP